MNKLLVKIWKLFGGYLQWRTLWLFHSKFIIGVSTVILNQDRQVLLLRHTFWKTGSWGLPSGYANSGEALEDTVRRELKEETNLDVTIERLLRINSGFKLRLEATFLGRLSGGKMILDPKEVIEAKFFNLEELPSGLLASHKEIIEKYQMTETNL